MHREWDSVEQAYNTNRLKIGDALDRTLAQVAQAEDEIYEQLRESDNRIMMHSDSGSLLDMISISHGDNALNNLQMAQQMGQESADHAVQANQLRQLVGARSAIWAAKADLLSAQGGAYEADLGDTVQRDLNVRLEEA